MKKTIKDFDLNNKKVIIRVDFNVPIKNNKITDDNRIKASLETINYAINNGAKVISFTLMGVKALLGCIIPLLRSITYFFIHSRVKVSDALAIQAQFLEANANQLKYSDDTMDEDRKKKVIAKQLKIAEKLRTWSNRLSIDYKKAKKEAEKDVAEDDKKKKADDLEGGNSSDDDLF